MKVVGVSLLLALCCLGSSLRAELVTPLSIEQLTAQADLILNGKVLSKKCLRDEAGRIYTEIDILILDVWKGKPNQNPIKVVHGGGELNGEKIQVEGQVEYSPREEIVAFLVLNQRGEAVTLGLSQGKFRVADAGRSGPKVVYNRFHGVARSNATLQPGSGELTLSALKEKVRANLK